ncbi:MAG: XdhC family protein [Pseudomonadota bacterium]
MRHKNRLFRQFEVWRNDGHEMVFALVVATSGSTYAKPGDFMLITDSGLFQGLLSGGCVEGDLALRAQDVLRSGGAAIVDYDLGGEHDALWGMGAGCDGRLQILLECLRGDALRVFVELAKRYADGRLSKVTLEGSLGQLQWHLVEAAQGSTSFELSDTWISGGFLITATPNVLVCGGGEDVSPLVDLATAMGWRVTVAEHRPHYVDSRAAEGAVVITGDSVAELTQNIEMQHYDAVVVMSHHLGNDIKYLTAIAQHAHWQYIGLLGPPHRRERLVKAVPQIEALGEVLYGPAGLNIGGREPASIALSIIAQIHQCLAGTGRLTGQISSRG